MESPTNLWQAWQLSKSYSCRPSEVYAIHDEVAAFCFDRAVSTFGRGLEAELDKAVNEAKSQAEANRKHALVLNRWLDQPQQFADPSKRLGQGA